MRGRCLVLAGALIAACGAPVGPAATPSLPAPTEAAVASAQPTALEAPTAAPTEAPASPSAEPADTFVPSPAPTVRPSPTLNWEESGFSASVRDPVKIGEKAKVTLKGPVGPTCTLKIKYPSGTNATLPSPTHPNPGWWQWIWTIPSKANGGQATGTATCTYGGVPHTGLVTFTITKPPPAWSIQADLPATFDHTTLPETGLLFPVTMVGTVPKNPDYLSQRITCVVDVNTAGNASYGQVFDAPWENGDGPLWIHWQVEFAASDVGMATWTVRCKSRYVTPEQWKYDSGSLEIT